MPEANGPYPWSTVGIALDYRIRYYFAVTAYEELIAYQGAQRLSDAQGCNSVDLQLDARRSGDTIIVANTRTGKHVGTYLPETDGAVGFDEAVPISEIWEIKRSFAEGITNFCSDEPPALARQFKDFFFQLDTLTSLNSPVGKRLPQAKEDELNRYCFVLALLEEVARTGRVDSLPVTGASANVESLLGLAKSDLIDDLTELSWEFYDGFNYLLGLPHVLNPKFEGSIDIGGADADMIVDGTLVEIKTTARGEIRSDWIWQLLGYVLLDYSDVYHINSVGLYMARQCKLFKWDLDEAIRSLGSEDSPSIGQLRTQFKALAKSLH